MNKPFKIGGLSLILLVLCIVAIVALESGRESLGFPDADDPGVMMRFLNDRIHIFAYSGFLFVLMGVLMTIAVLAVWETVEQDARSPTFRFGTLFAGYVAAYLLPTDPTHPSPRRIIAYGKLEPRVGQE